MYNAKFIHLNTYSLQYCKYINLYTQKHQMKVNKVEKHTIFDILYHDSHGWIIHNSIKQCQCAADFMPHTGRRHCFTKQKWLVSDPKSLGFVTTAKQTSFRVAPRQSFRRHLEAPRAACGQGGILEANMFKTIVFYTVWGCDRPFRSHFEGG